MTPNASYLSNLNSGEAMMNHLWGIIDSRIQYLNYQTDELTRPFASSDNLTGAEVDLGILMTWQDNLQKAEQWFLQFEKLSRQKKTLLLIRNHLNRLNAYTVLSILSDDSWMTLSQKELEYKLGVRRQSKAA